MERTSKRKLWHSPLPSPLHDVRSRTDTMYARRDGGPPYDDNSSSSASRFRRKGAIDESGDHREAEGSTCDGQGAHTV